MTGDAYTPGSLGEELTRLVRAAQQWLGDTLAERPAGTAPECALCPVCRFLARLRADRTDAARMGEVTDVLAAAVRSLLDPTPRPPRPGGAPPVPGERVHRIDIG